MKSVTFDIPKGQVVVIRDNSGSVTVPIQELKEFLKQYDSRNTEEPARANYVAVSSAGRICQGALLESSDDGNLYFTEQDFEDNAPLSTEERECMRLIQEVNPVPNTTSALKSYQVPDNYRISRKDLACVYEVIIQAHLEDSDFAQKHLKPLAIVESFLGREQDILMVPLVVMQTLYSILGDMCLQEDTSGEGSAGVLARFHSNMVHNVNPMFDNWTTDYSKYPKEEDINTDDTWVTFKHSLVSLIDFVFDRNDNPVFSKALRYKDTLLPQLQKSIRDSKGTHVEVCAGLALKLNAASSGIEEADVRGNTLISLQSLRMFVEELRGDDVS